MHEHIDPPLQQLYFEILGPEGFAGGGESVQRSRFVGVAELGGERVGGVGLGGGEEGGEEGDLGEGEGGGAGADAEGAGMVLGVGGGGGGGGGRGGGHVCW